MNLNRRCGRGAAWASARVVRLYGNVNTNKISTAVRYAVRRPCRQYERNRSVGVCEVSSYVRIELIDDTVTSDLGGGFVTRLSRE